MKSIWTDLLSLLFPECCTICLTPLITGEEKICLSCLSKLSYTRFGITPNPTSKLFAGRPEIGWSSAFLLYAKGGITQKLIYQLKYYGDKELGHTLGRLAAMSISQSYGFVLPDVLIPVPLHKRRLRKRGYNQSEWIARGLNSVWGVPIDTQHLIRSRKTKTQTQKNLYNRMINMETSFQTINIGELEGKHVLIIDDVLTTGATLNACINELSTCNNIKISVFSLSIAI